LIRSFARAGFAPKRLCRSESLAFILAKQGSLQVIGLAPRQRSGLPRDFDNQLAILYIFYFFSF